MARLGAAQGCTEALFTLGETHTALGQLAESCQLFFFGLGQTRIALSLAVDCMIQGLGRQPNTVR